MSKKYDPHWIEMRECARRGDLEEMKRLHSLGSDIDRPDLLLYAYPLPDMISWLVCNMEAIINNNLGRLIALLDDDHYLAIVRLIKHDETLISHVKRPDDYMLFVKSAAIGIRQIDNYADVNILFVC